jgi:hypothetical protein
MRKEPYRLEDEDAVPDRVEPIYDEPSPDADAITVDIS